MKPRIEVIRIVRRLDESPDLSYLGAYGNKWKPGAIDREELGDLGRHEYQYFYPAMTGEETGNLDSPSEDYRRMESYGRGDWCMLGLIAEAQVSVQKEGVQRLETFTSSGLWGIESDSGRDYIEEVKQDELADLKSHLESFGVDTSNFADLADEAEEVER